jgi:transcriptional antiterminator RfaH
MRRWYVVHTHPQAESRALLNLKRQGFDAYLPRCRKWRRHARKAEVVAGPLFPRYLFLRLDIDVERWRPVLSTFGVGGLICRDGLPAPVPGGIIEAILAREDAGHFVDLTRQAEIRPGDRVQVTAGPFADRIAVFAGLNEGQRVILLLDLLGRKLRVEVAPEAVTACA